MTEEQALAAGMPAMGASLRHLGAGNLRAKAGNHQSGGFSGD
jgi:hypothetical protein